jgi:hypothetical protein
MCLKYEVLVANLAYLNLIALLNIQPRGYINQGTLTEGDDSLQMPLSLIVYFLKKIFFNIKSSLSELVSTRKSTVLIPPLWEGFPVLVVIISTQLS